MDGFVGIHHNIIHGIYLFFSAPEPWGFGNMIYDNIITGYYYTSGITLENCYLNTIQLNTWVESLCV